MTTKQASPQDEVKRLADIAQQAAIDERARRSGLVVRGRETARKGLLIGVGTAAGVVVMSMLLRHRRDEKDGKEQKRSRGIFETAGASFLALVRFAVTASQAWALASTPQPTAAAAETLPDA